MTKTKCKSITKTGKPCGHKAKTGRSWCVHHIAANWPAKAPATGPTEVNVKVLETGREMEYKGQIIHEVLVTIPNPTRVVQHYRTTHKNGNSGIFGSIEDAQRYIRMRNPH